MKYAIICAALTCLVPMLAIAQIQQTAPDADIHALIDAQAKAWNANDAAAWARDFKDDATFTNIRGDMVSGRAGVEKLHAFIFAGPYHGSHAVVTVDRIRFPSPAVAIVETTHTVTNFKGLPPGVAATEPGVLRTRMNYVLVNEQGSWKIYTAQNTSILPQPLMPQ